MTEGLWERMGRTTRAAPWVGAGIGLLTLAGLVLLLANRSLIYGNDVFLWGLFTAASISYIVAGLAIVRRSTSPIIGWLCLLIALALELGLTLSHYAIYAIGVHPGSLPAPGLMLAIARTTPFLSITGIVLILHLFPTGEPASRRWRWLVIATLCAQTGVMLISLFGPGRITDVWSDELSHAGVSAANPLGIEAVHPIARIASPVLGFIYVVGAAGAVASLFARRKTATPEQRQQVRWIATLAALAAIWITVLLPIMVLTDPLGPAGALFWLVITPLVALGPPAAIGIAILKYRLYDIDVVIRKTLVFGLLAGSITVVYVAIVVGLGSLLANTLALRLVATAVVAIAFQPARQRADRLANRLVYGKRATPYEVLARFAERMGDTYASEDVVVRIARVIAEGAAASKVDVWLRLGSEFHQAGSWPSDGSAEPVPAPEDGLPEIRADRVVPVRHRGEVLGVVSVSKPPGEPLKANEAELLERLADQSGLVLANVRLTADLEARLDQISRQAAELRASRQRIVAAQDEERRRLERNIHDGAQQHLVALAVRLKLARSLLGTDRERGRKMLSEVRGQLDAALDTLRALSLGIYPPLLEEQGIAAALAAQYLSSGLPVTMRTESLDRHPVEIEAAVYFCVLEALQNAAKHARASRIEVALGERDGSIRFEVRDDGVGFEGDSGKGTGLAGINDRLAVFGGSAQIRSEPGKGTVVHGRIPLSLAVSA
jgi:signal transduction histidine kinase